MNRYTLTIQDLIENDVNIFDFEYPYYLEGQPKKDFEQLFIDHFMFSEIGHETVSRFKHQLKVKLNLIMPYYNKIFESGLVELRLLDNYDVTETYTRNTEGTNKNLYKDAPKTKIDIDKMDIVNSISKDIHDNSETWERRMTGNIGVATDADAITNYWTSLRKLTEEIFEKELSDLFMGVY